jgi:catechol-2,3-dioxygenase
MTSPTLAHVILNTSNYEETKEWYLEVLNATIGVETSAHTACFLRTDETHHRIGMFNVNKADDSLAQSEPGAGGDVLHSRLNHFAFEYPTLAGMLETHQRIAKSSITPSMCLNHGPTMSMYYEDPDHNAVELFYDNKFSEEEIVAFYEGGDDHVLAPIRFDPAELLQQLRAGTSVAELTAWSPRDK